jgi:hypothetical protein
VVEQDGVRHKRAEDEMLTGIAKLAISMDGSRAKAMPSATLMDIAVWKNSGITLT